MKRHLGLVVLLALSAPAHGKDRAEPVQTLDATNIEGEIRLPQVLFITSRESDRPIDFLEWYAPMTSLEIGRESPMPNRIHVVQLEQLETEDAPADSEGSGPHPEGTSKEKSP